MSFASHDDIEEADRYIIGAPTLIFRREDGTWKDVHRHSSDSPPFTNPSETASRMNYEEWAAFWPQQDPEENEPRGEASRDEPEVGINRVLR